MNPKEYIENVLKTEATDFEGMRKRLQSDTILRLDHAADIICTEAGEFKDSIRAWKFYGKELNGANLVEELGDILYPIAVACHALNISIEEVMEKNIAKLRARYGEKFCLEKYENRNLEAETRASGSVADFASVHFSRGGVTTVCGELTKNVGYYTGNIADATCKKCVKGAKVNYGTSKS